MCVITLFSFLSIATPVAPVLTVSASSAPESRGELFLLRFTVCRRLRFFLWFVDLFLVCYDWFSFLTRSNKMFSEKFRKSSIIAE